MPTTAAQVQPAKGRHAIQNCTFAVEFAAPLASEQLAALSRRYDEDAALKAWFPRKSEHRGGYVLDSSHVKGADLLQGLSLARIAPDGSVEWGLSANPGVVTISCSAYSRWTQVREQALVLLEALLSAIGNARVSALGLQYVDEFFWVGERTLLNASAFFDASTPLLPPHVFTAIPPAWHSHNGWFVDHAQALKYRELVNVNVNLLSQPERIVAQVITTHRAIVPAPLDAKSPRAFTGYYEALHDSNKRQLGVLLNKDVQRLIDLEAKDRPA